MVDRVMLGSVLLAFALGLELSGCGGSSTKVESSTTATTIGRELQDLDEAYQKGIITKGEYEKAKKKILERY